MIKQKFTSNFECCGCEGVRKKQTRKESKSKKKGNKKGRFRENFLKGEKVSLREFALNCLR